MIQEASRQLMANSDLSAPQMQAVMEEIMSGQAETADIVAFLTALSDKRETAEEISAAAAVMCRYALHVDAAASAVLDTCGTGGDRAGTFNVSTAAAFVVAGCGVTVAKHGNRSVSSLCGSADILEATGVRIDLSKEKIERCLRGAGIAFLFAPGLHPAMKHAMPARKQINRKTIFNILGPLCNPAPVTHQLIGVYAAYLVPIVAAVLASRGLRHALVVHGNDGLDEITTTAATTVAEYSGGNVTQYEILPEAFGFERVNAAALAGGSAAENVQIMLEVLSGKPGPRRDIVVLNAACALYVADTVSSIRDGIRPAVESIDSGAALKKLALLKQISNEKD